MTPEKPYTLFNVGEATELPTVPGAVRLSRYPQQLEAVYTLGGGKLVSRQSTGCEIRFVPEGTDFELTLSSPDSAKVHFYQGSYWQQALEMEGGRTYAFRGSVNETLLRIRSESEPTGAISTKVVRLRVERGTVHFHGLDTYGFPCRAPKSEELPTKRWLAWGSSITQSDTYGYIHQAANRLGVDVLNKGLSGSCGAEPEVAEWLSHQNEWDFATCEWGVNMRNTIDPDEFESRINGSLDHFLSFQKPAFLITSFLNSSHLQLEENAVISERQSAYDEILREAVAKRSKTHPQLHLIEGRDVLQSPTWLNADLIHPSHDGHNRMGEVLAGRLDSLLSENSGT